MKNTEPIITKPYLIEKIWAAPSACRWGKSGIGEAILFSGDLCCPVKTEKGSYYSKELPKKGIAFPYTIKAIDTAFPLSVQVHPIAKNEMWYIEKAAEDAYVYLDFRNQLSLGEIQDACQKGTVLSKMNRIRVKNGDIIFVPGGLPHAIGGNIGLIEVADIGSCTYRLYDYGRGRALQQELFQQNIKADALASNNNRMPHMRVISFDGNGEVFADAVTVYVVLKGKGDIFFGSRQVKIKKDLCFLLPRGGSFCYDGSGEILTVLKA